MHSYLDVADDKKLKAIYTLLERDIAASASEDAGHWESPEFVAEINRRLTDMQSGKDKGHTWRDSINALYRNNGTL